MDVGRQLAMSATLPQPNPGIFLKSSGAQWQEARKLRDSELVTAL